jgi:hypothetical protein
VLFASNQHSVNEQILHRLAPNAGRHLPALKTSDIDLFEPVAQPDAAAAILFIDTFNDAVRQYGEDRVLLIMKRCCNNAVALSCLTSVSEDDCNGLITSIAEWERLLRRDFIPKLADLETRARDETFKWSQNRTPTQYVSDKIKLLKIASITDPDKGVYELHRGFHRCSELQISLTHAVKETGNDVAHYRMDVLNVQGMAKLQYEFNQRSSGATYTPRTREPAPRAALAHTKRQVPSSCPARQKDRPRKRKCRNYPACGDGEHWDWECKIKAPERDNKKRAYYAFDDDDDDSLCFELRVEDSDIEENYKQCQNAHVAAAYCASKGFFGGIPSATTQKSRMTSPKPSECQTCHEAFPSRLWLHAHLLTSGHNCPAQAHFAVIKSKHVAPRDQEARLASYHSAEAQFVLQPGSSNSRISCVDSGYGNSAVDAAFVSQRVPNPIYQLLKEPKKVCCIGGGIAMCEKLLMLPVYYPTMDGNFAEITGPSSFHVFLELGVDLLLGIDTIREEGIDIFFSSTVPQMRIASCQNAAVKIDVWDGDRVSKIPVRAASTIVVPANSTTIVEIQVSRHLPSKQDYLFTPSKLKSVSAASAGAPHAIVSPDQKNIMFTNLHDTDITLFKNTVVRHLHSTASEDVAVWHEAAQEVRGFLGLSKIAKACTAALAFAGTASSSKQVFNPEANTPMPLPDGADSPPFPLESPSPRPCLVASQEILPDSACSTEKWSPPSWLHKEYALHYEYDLPAGIRIPNVSMTTYTQVVVNETDDI